MNTLRIPDLWQAEAVGHLRAGRDVVLDAPTGAGKTFVFEVLYPELKGQAIYTVPTRALANDKLLEWRRRSWDVGIATGDVLDHPEARVIVATLETQKPKLIRGEGPGLLVIDEYQMIGDTVRGLNYELSVALAPASTQLLLLSGSVGNAQDVVDWLRRIGRDAVLVRHVERPVPLEEVILDQLDVRTPRGVEGFWPRMVAKALAAGLGPILVFAPRRAASERIAAAIAAAVPCPDPLSLTQEQKLLVEDDLARLLSRRVAFHHSGLSYGARAALVEPLAKSGQLNVVVATMGLAAGINFSMRSVLVTDTAYNDGPFQKEVRPDELLQMFGRAGRRGLDETGYVLVLSQGARMHQASPLRLRRSSEMDWPAMLAVAGEASRRGELPLSALGSVVDRLFSAKQVRLGFEHCLETGARPCGLWVDAERARYIRRGVTEVLGPKGWVLAEAKGQAPMNKVWISSQGKLRAALRDATTLQDLGTGRLCKIRMDNGWMYGKEVPLAIAHRDKWKPVRPIRTALRKRRLATEDATREIVENAWVPLVSRAAAPGKFHSIAERAGTLYAVFEFTSHFLDAVRISSGEWVAGAESRIVEPPSCRTCDQRGWCASADPAMTPALAWRRLGLIERDGTLTPRGRIASFFQGGEGLAVAAALEDPEYPIEDLVYDLANVRAGHRFAGDEPVQGGRLGFVCQQTYERADFPGYLAMGVPPQYGAGAAEVARAVFEENRRKETFVRDQLRLGDIERMLVEWRSLLRHVASASAWDWNRWKELQRQARAISGVHARSPLMDLPSLTPAQMRERFLRRTPAGH